MSEIKEKLDEYIKQGQEIYQRMILIERIDNGKPYDLSDETLINFKMMFYNWINNVTFFLNLNFNKIYLSEFHSVPFTTNNNDNQNTILNIKDNILGKISVLNALKENFEYIEKKNHSLEEKATNIKSNKIFIVHGRNEAAKLSVESFLKDLGLEPIILHKQANQGQTIIEKIEAHSDVAFAVVLLTPDDEGKLKGATDLEDRARQNVIFELGYFSARLGRKYVCGLCTEGFNLPSDYDGVLYIPMDKHDGWHKKLAKEIKASGIEFDMNKLLEV